MMKTIRKPRKLEKRKVIDFPGTDFTEFKVGGEYVKIHNSLKAEMLLFIDNAIRLFAMRSKEMREEERKRYIS